MQEHHLVFDQSIAAEQALLQAAGWRAFFAPATQLPGALQENHSSGGVAVLVREEFSASATAVIIPRRGIGVDVPIPQLSDTPIFVVSAYFSAGQGLHMPIKKSRLILRLLSQPDRDPGSSLPIGRPHQAKSSPPAWPSNPGDALSHSRIRRYSQIGRWILQAH